MDSSFVIPNSTKKMRSSTSDKTCFTWPEKVYELTSYRKQTKNQWARDDPAFLVVLVGFLLTVCVAYGIAFQARLPATTQNRNESRSGLASHDFFRLIWQMSSFSLLSK